MRIAVLGLWHLGSVTSASLARAGHQVVGHDVDAGIVASLAGGVPAIAEPGLAELVAEGLAAGRLRFTPSIADAVADAEVAWVAYDTPVDDDDRGDAAWVADRVLEAAPHLPPRVCLFVSSQVPVGTTARLVDRLRSARPDLDLSAACLPENLRLGSAISAFVDAPAVVAGASDQAARAAVAAVVAPLGLPIEWMSIESAEMTKHALNAFLAMSVAFTNEIASICERTGADVLDVVRALRRDPRIGERAYLAAGLGFAGGTLGRDVVYVTDTVRELDLETPLLSAIQASNRRQHRWVRRVLSDCLGDLAGRRIAIWGLTYKPGTDTLRRSASVELCRWLVASRAEVVAHDPAVRSAADLSDAGVVLAEAPLDAAEGADALVVMTPWPEYAAIPADAVAERLAGRLVVDPGRATTGSLGSDGRFRYLAVGRAT